MRENTRDNDPSAVGGMAADPHYDPNGQRLNAVPPRPTQQTHTNPSNKGKMDGGDYSYVEGVPEQWSLPTAFSGAPAIDGSQTGTLTNENWENFLQWNPAQAQANGHGNGQVENESMRSGTPKDALYTRRPGSALRDPQLGLSSAESSAMGGLPASSGMPYSFGPATATSPSFAFHPNGLVSPSQGQRPAYPDPSYWTSRPQMDQNGSALASPMSFDGQPPFGSTSSHNLTAGSMQHSPASADTRNSSTPSDPSSPETGAPNNSSKKRKSASAEAELNSSGKPAPIKKTAHNMIEKRYRTNLNDKIAALRDSVPSLRVMSRPNGQGDVEDDGEDLGGLTPAHKLNKATVLSKATEYIRFLEKRNKKLSDELAAVKHRLEAYEKLSMGPMMTVNTPDSVSRYQEDPFTRTAPGVSSGPPQGMIPVPENIMALHRASVNQPHYAHGPGYPGYNPAPPNSRPGMPSQQQQQGQHQQPMVSGRGSGLANKLMVGSLAGLMLVEGFYEREQSGEEPQARGLFAVPFTLLGRLVNFFIPRTVMFGVSPYDALSTLKLFMIVGAFGYLILPLLDFKPRPKKKASAVSLSPAPSLASPVEVRRTAWLTAIQTVWVPRHNFWLEVAALLLKMLKLSTRKLIGWHGYAILTGITKDQELARVKAWDIALDAQLTGGDAEISMSRLVLTLMASGTLPDTPARLMLKALHIRVLLWEVAKAGYGTWYMFEELSANTARSYWNAARSEHKMLVANTQDGDKPSDLLPHHLAALLEHGADEVLNKLIIQRAYNLAWNRPSTENSQTKEGVDSVVEDFAISSPLDALAAWWSSHKLLTVLAYSYEYDSPERHCMWQETLEDALRTAPPTSIVQLRALTAKAVLVKDKREDHIAAAFEAFPRDDAPGSPGSEQQLSLVNIVGQVPASEDIRVALTLAKCIYLAEESVQKPDDSLCWQWRNAAIAQANRYKPNERDFTLLSFSAALKVVDTFVAVPELLDSCRPTLENVAHEMRVWAGKASIPVRSKKDLVQHCVNLIVMLARVSFDNDDVSDAGYVSQET